MTKLRKLNRFTPLPNGWGCRECPEPCVNPETVPYRCLLWCPGTTSPKVLVASWPSLTYSHWLLGTITVPSGSALIWYDENKLLPCEWSEYWGSWGYQIPYCPEFALLWVEIFTLYDPQPSIYLYVEHGCIEGDQLLACETRWRAIIPFSDTCWDPNPKYLSFLSSDCPVEPPGLASVGIVQ
jgi:hypothetical protein